MSKLTEAVEAQKFHETEGYVMREGFNSGIDTALLVIRQHEADNCGLMEEKHYWKRRAAEAEKQLRLRWPDYRYSDPKEEA